MRLIDADRLKGILEYGILCNVPADVINTKEEKWNDWVQEVVDKAPTVEAIPKDQYETRLKADRVAMLTDLQLEIEELDSRAGYDGNGMPTFSTDYIRKNKVNELIQQKVDKLKGEEE